MLISCTFGKVRREFFGHLLFWVILTITYSISDWGHMPGFGDAFLYELIYLPVRIIAVYVNWMVLIPKLLYKGNVFLYILVLGLLLTATAMGQRYFTLYWAYPIFFPEYVKAPIRPWELIRLVQNIVVIASAVAFSTGIKIFIDWYKERNRNRRLVLEKREAELKYLKGQINPHFLFNALNNIYGLALEQSRNVPTLILKLSELLSFSLYESSEERIEIEKEIEIIESYIELERARYEEGIEIDWSVSEHLDLKLKIAPLLLMPVVENAFKYCSTLHDQKPFVRFSMETQNHYLIFTSSNSLSEFLEANPDGIGLSNLRRRLELLYTDDFQLDINRNINEFNVAIQFPVYA